MDTSNASEKPSSESWRDEPTQPKQKAVLEFLKMPVPPTRGGASNMIQAVFESPAGYAHRSVWDATKHELHPDLYPPEPEKKIPVAKPPTLFGYAVKGILVLAAIFYAIDKYQEKGGGPAPSPESEPAVATPAAAVKNTPAPQTPERKPVSEIIALESTDGKTIQAKVLALTKTTVLIRRADGQTFDLPIDRLTADSKQRIEEYRAAKRAGLVK